MTRIKDSKHRNFATTKELVRLTFGDSPKCDCGNPATIWVHDMTPLTTHADVGEAHKHVYGDGIEVEDTSKLPSANIPLHDTNGDLLICDACARKLAHLLLSDVEDVDYS
jgi:hypothetical protein